MYSAEKYLGAMRLGVFRDDFCEDTFIIANGEMIFARINLIEGKWCVWFYTLHLQRSFDKFRDALSNVNEEFLTFLRGRG